MLCIPEAASDSVKSIERMRTYNTREFSTRGFTLCKQWRDANLSASVEDRIYSVRLNASGHRSQNVFSCVTRETYGRFVCKITRRWLAGEL